MLECVFFFFVCVCMFLVCVYLLVVVVFCVCFFHAVDVLERALTQRTKPRCFFISSEEPDTKSTTSVGSKGADTRTVSAVWFRTTVRTSSVSNDDDELMLNVLRCHLTY